MFMFIIESVLNVCGKWVAHLLNHWNFFDYLHYRLTLKAVPFKSVWVGGRYGRSFEGGGAEF